MPRFKPQDALNDLTRATPVVELAGQFSDISKHGPAEDRSAICPSTQAPPAQQFRSIKDARGKTNQKKEGQDSQCIVSNSSRTTAATESALSNISNVKEELVDLSNSDANHSDRKADKNGNTKNISPKEETEGRGVSQKTSRQEPESREVTVPEWKTEEWDALSQEKVPDIPQRIRTQSEESETRRKVSKSSTASSDDAKKKKSSTVSPKSQRNFQRKSSSVSVLSEQDGGASVHGENLLRFFEDCYDQNSPDVLRGADVVKFLKSAGLLADDPRLEQHIELLQKCERVNESNASSILDNSLIRKALRGDLAMKNFPEFVQAFKDLYNDVMPNEGGHVATYIPQLANQNPNLWGVALCTVHGQRFSVGDSAIPFCVQSTSKPITYCVALEINGDEKVHRHVGREPSGRNFNDRCLMNRKGQNAIPHNPYINAGAIMTSALVKMDVSEWDRFTYMMTIWQKLSAGTKPSFQNDTFMGERATASRNFCLAYMMEEENAFPHKTDLTKTLEAYFSWCSIEITAESMAMVAATLANGGICPSTNERIFTHQTVTSCLSLMMSCGMYDFSGQFAFQIGFPAKSGVSGIMCIVVPGVFGLATFSPRLDSLGNSVRGIDFCQRLSKRFPYHVFSQPQGDECSGRKNSKGERKISKDRNRYRSGSKEPAREQVQTAVDQFISNVTQSITDDEYASLWWSATRNDVQRVRQLAVRGLDINTQDCDKRSALHLAACEGHDSMVALLIELRADTNARDLHGSTPLDDAVREHKNSAKRVLQLAARSWQAAKAQPIVDLESARPADQLFLYFTGNSLLGHDGVRVVARRTLIETLDGCGLNADMDPRFAFLKDFPDPFSAQDLRKAADCESLIARALCGKLCVPNFALFSEKFEELFTKMTDTVKERQWNDHPADLALEEEVLNVMTKDGQRIHLGRSDQTICMGGLMSLIVFSAAIEFLGEEVVMEFVGAEPSGVNSDTSILNHDKLPFNPFMWNGMLALISLLDEKCGDAIRVIEMLWAKLCNDGSDEPMQCDEAWMEEDKRKHEYRVKVLLYTSLDLQKFPDQTPPDKVMDIFFHLRSIRTNTLKMGSVGAVLANRGKHPLTAEQVLQPETVKYILSMMYAAGCDAQSGEFSFKVGVPAKTSREGGVLLVLPNVMGLFLYSPGVNDRNVSHAGMDFCTNFANEFNCHVLAGNSTSSAKADPSLYHFQNDSELCQQLLFAAESGELMQLSALHQLGFSLDNTDYDYRSAVHIAACNNQLAALKYLAKKGANMHPRDRWGFTPYDDALRCGHHRVAAYLNCLGKPDPDDHDWDTASCGSFASNVSPGRRGSQSHQVKRVQAPCAAKYIESGKMSSSARLSHHDIRIDEGDEEAFEDAEFGSNSEGML